MISIFFTFENEHDEDLFNSIYTNERYKNVLYKNAYKITQDNYLAEDAVQETFLILMRNISKFDEVYSKRTLKYLITVVKHVSLTLIKLKNNKNTKCYEDLSEKEIERFILQDKDVFELDDNFFIDALNNLDSELTNLLILKYLYGYSLKEIAHNRDISIKNVGVKLHRGKNKIKKFLNLERWNMHE